MRPIGMPATIWAMASFGSGAKIGVSMMPGLLTLAQILHPHPGGGALLQRDRHVIDAITVAESNARGEKRSAVAA
jgi:hypothetical protein